MQGKGVRPLHTTYTSSGAAFSNPGPSLPQTLPGPRFRISLSFRPKCGKPSENTEALSWTEYRQALTELSPTFRRHGIAATNNSGERATAGATPGGTNHVVGGSRRRAGRCSSPSVPSLADERYRDPWEDMVDRTASCTSPLRQRCNGLQNGEVFHHGDGVRDRPPRSPGADSYGVLRRKRHAAVSLDYEGITKELPQVGLPSEFA